MEKRINRLINKSSKKTLLDSPVPNSKIMFLPSGKNAKRFIVGRKDPPFKSKIIKLLPEPLKPTKYRAPKPTPKPRVKSKRPVPLPRSSSYPKPIAEKVKKLIDEITPYYNPEAITAFNKILEDKKLQIVNQIVKITEYKML